MRPIKFRAWHKADEKMYEVYGFAQNKSFRNHLFWFLKGKQFPMPNGAVVIMQYTGLKDKNGKEIYEQDILEVESFEGSKSVVRVVFDDGCFCHIGHLGDLRTYPLREFLFNGSRTQVIGNIYEHPHLLEEQHG